MKAFVLAFASVVLLTPARAASLEGHEVQGWSRCQAKGLTVRQAQHLAVRGEPGAAERGRVEARPVNVSRILRTARPTLTVPAYTITAPRAYLSPFEANALAIHVGVL